MEKCWSAGSPREQPYRPGRSSVLAWGKCGFAMMHSGRIRTNPSSGRCLGSLAPQAPPGVRGAAPAFSPDQRPCSPQSITPPPGLCLGPVGVAQLSPSQGPFPTPQPPKGALPDPHATCTKHLMPAHLSYFTSFDLHQDPVKRNYYLHLPDEETGARGLSHLSDVTLPVRGRARPQPRSASKPCFELHAMALSHWLLIP